MCDKVDDGTVDSRRLMEERQKLLNDIERLRAENDSLKVLVHHVPHVTVASLLQQGSHASWKVLDFLGKISRPWKVLENGFGLGKSWKF